MRNCESIVCPEEEDPVCAKQIKGGSETTFLNSCLITVAECQSLHSEYKEKGNALTRLLIIYFFPNRISNRFKRSLPTIIATLIEIKMNKNKI